MSRSGRSSSHAAVAVVALVSMALAASTACADRSPKRPDPTRLLFLVEYVGSDYDRAVEGGAVIDQLELLRAQLGERAGSASIPDQGVFIDDVFDPSPATRAGVQRGDFLVRMGDAEVASVADFQRALYGTGIGKQARLRLLRGKRPIDVTATVEARPRAAAMR